MEIKKLCENITQIKNGNHITDLDLKDTKNELEEVTRLTNLVYRERWGEPELEQYYKSFIKSVETYKDYIESNQTNLDKINYLIKEQYINQKDIDKQYEEYKSNEGEDAEDYEEWIDNDGYENEDTLDEWIRENNSGIDIQFYVDKKEVDKRAREESYDFTEDYKATIMLGYGGPNIYVEVSSRFKNVEYGIYWWGSKYEKDCSYLFDEIEQMYDLEAYLF